MTDASWTDAGTTLATAREAIAAFNAEREWAPFHTPRDLAMCVSVEAGELLEAFLWKSQEESVNRGAVEEEIADVLISCINLADQLDLDLMACIQRKLRLNGERYPVELAKGSAQKHDQLTDR